MIPTIKSLSLLTRKYFIILFRVSWMWTTTKTRKQNPTNSTISVSFVLTTADLFHSTLKIMVINNIHE
jgi:hypothetical protein